MSDSFYVLTVKLSQDDADALSGLLFLEECRGLEESDVPTHKQLIKAYFDGNKDIDSLVKSLKEKFIFDEISYSSHKISEVQFKPAPFDPIHLAGDYWIVPPDDLPCDKPLEQGKPLIIRPGTAFGTGRHETTRLVSLFLAEEKTKGSLLDVGSGSGILSILGQKLGFHPITAVEIDEQARENAVENLELNNVTIPLYDHIDQANQSYDLIVANILAPILIRLHDDFIKRLKTGSKLILSGILQEEKNEVLDVYKDLELIAEKNDKEWCALQFRKN